MSLSEKPSPLKDITLANILCLIYVIGFILSGYLIFTYKGAPLITTGCILALLTISLYINLYHIKQRNLDKEILGNLNQVYEGLINNNIIFSILINYKNEIVFCKHKKLAGINFKNIMTMTDVLNIFHSMNISDAKQKELSNFVFKNPQNNYQTTIGPICCGEINICISLNYITKPYKYKLITIFEQDYLNSPIEISNQLSIGYYEINKNGIIVGSNEYFSRLLGLDSEAINKSNIYLKDLINVEGSINAFVPNEHGTSALKSNWQGVLTFESKFKEKIMMFTVHKAVQSEHNSVTIIQGFVIKLHDQSIILKAKGFENGWIDYSWKCFFENSPYPVSILNEYGKIIRTNNAFLDLLPCEPTKNYLADLFKHDDQILIKKAINTSNSIKNQVFTLNELYDIGNKKILDVHINEITNPNGKNIGFIVRLVDITQQKELEDNLSHAQRMQTIGHLVGSVAHDFNNLLTAIGGFSDLLLLKHRVDDPSFVNIIQIKQSSDRASSLVKRLLAFSRKQTLKPSTVDLNEAFSDFYAIIKRLIGNEIIFTQQVSPIVWNVKIDPVQLEQVILNLAINAHQAMVNGGKLNISAQNCSLNERNSILKDYIAPAGEKLPPPGEYIEIAVQDTGSGIPKEIMQNIFEPFFTTKNDKSGTGLGLATVYGIIRQSEGHIYIKSEIGKGTTFLIFLKRYQATEEELVKLQKTLIADEIDFNKPNQDLSGKETIVLVEDEESVRLFTKNALTNKGYNVIEYSSANQALKSIENFISVVDLIISDVVMPDMTGPEMVTKIKEMKPAVKVIFISGFGEEAFTEEYGNDRNFHFIAKPFSFKQLIMKVKQVIQ